VRESSASLRYFGAGLSFALTVMFRIHAPHGAQWIMPDAASTKRSAPQRVQ